MNFNTVFLYLLSGLWLFSIIACGLVSGPGLLAFLMCSVVLCRIYWRVVVSRTRMVVAVQGVFVGEFYGERYFER